MPLEMLYFYNNHLSRPVSSYMHVPRGPPAAVGPACTHLGLSWPQLYRVQRPECPWVSSGWKADPKS